MPAGPRLLLKQACYHIIVRGNCKQIVFYDSKDYSVYLRILSRCKKRYGFSLYGYCLMPNHIHMVGEPVKPDGLSRFMQGLNRAYTAYFNKRYNKVGHLWQGRFKSKPILKDSYLLDCIHYVELNPLRASMVKSSGEYEWSSYRERIFAKGNNGLMLNALKF